jgi:hypothetical protein
VKPALREDVKAMVQREPRWRSQRSNARTGDVSCVIFTAGVNEHVRTGG